MKNRISETINRIIPHRRPFVTIFVCHIKIILCQGDFREQIKKIDKIVTLYNQDLFMKRPSLDTFCTQ